MQTWIITELAIRIWNNTRIESTTDYTKLNKLLFWGELGVVTLTVSVFIGFTTASYMLYYTKYDELAEVIAFAYLALFIMMATVNIVLFWTLKK